MELTPGARDRIAGKYGDFPKEVVERIAADAVAEASGPREQVAAPSPFAIAWMDSYLAHWELRNKLSPPERAGEEVAEVVRQLIDVRFRERLDEIRDLIRARYSPPDGGTPEPGVPPVGPAGIFADPPDGGPPEPGVPPVGPAGIFADPPDGGPPEPGVPPVGPAGIFADPPDGGPPEPGVPPVGPAGIFAGPPDGGTPEPGVPAGPPVGPATASLDENPWILYWFVSVKAPQLLDVMDAHLDRRLSELAAELR